MHTGKFVLCAVHYVTAQCPLVSRPTATMHSVCSLLQRLKIVLQTFRTCMQHIRNPSIATLMSWCTLTPTGQSADHCKNLYMFGATMVQCTPHAVICTAHHHVLSACVHDLKKRCAPSNWGAHGHAQCRFTCYNQIGSCASFAAAKICKHCSPCLGM